MLNVFHPNYFGRLLDYAMDPAILPSQDFFTVISYIATNRQMNDLLWGWARLNYESIVQRFENRHFPTVNRRGLGSNYLTSHPTRMVHILFYSWKLYPRTFPGSFEWTSSSWLRKSPFIGTVHKMWQFVELLIVQMDQFCVLSFLGLEPPSPLVAWSTTLYWTTIHQKSCNR